MALAQRSGSSPLLPRPGCRTMRPMTASPPHQLDVKVYYEDTDSLGVVYYANYLKYLERGRTEMIATLGRTVAEWNRDGFNFAVYQANLTFKAPARLGDVCQVLTQTREGSKYRLLMDQEIRLQDELLVKAEIHVVCLDDSLQLRELPAGVLPPP